jgi:hypothetical protein
MQAETARQCMTDIGLSRENADYVTALLHAGRRDEAWKKLRVIRCEMIRMPPNLLCFIGCVNP